MKMEIVAARGGNIGNGVRKRAPKRVALLVACLAVGLLPGGVWATQIYNPGTLNFSTAGQSMWGAGSATILDTSFFLGTTWNASGSFGPGISGGIVNTTIPLPHLHLPSGWECHGFLCTSGHFHNSGGIHIHKVPGPTVDTRTGGQVDINTNGRVGFNFGAKLDSGSVGATVEFAAKAVLPDASSLGTGEFFNLNPLSNPNSVLTDGQLDTNLAEVSAKLQAVIGARASLAGQVCFIAAGCASDVTSIGFPDQTVELLSFNDTDSPGQIKILNALNPGVFQFDNEISIPSPTNPLGSVGGVTLHVPDINASGGVTGDHLAASGMDDFIDLRVDLDGLALAPLGLPGLGVSVNAGIFSASADLIDVDMGPTITLKQDFELKPTLWVDLQFDRPVMVAGNAGPVTSWTSAWDSLPDIALLNNVTNVTPTFFVKSMFSNNTLLGIDGVFQLDILKASLALEALGLSFDIGEIGPLFQVLKRTNLFNTPPLFASSYALGGFNRVQAASFRLAVPEPASLMLMLLGLVVLVGLARRQPKVNFTMVA